MYELTIIRKDGSKSVQVSDDMMDFEISIFVANKIGNIAKLRYTNDRP